MNTLLLVLTLVVTLVCVTNAEELDTITFSDETVRQLQNNEFKLTPTRELVSALRVHYGIEGEAERQEGRRIFYGTGYFAVCAVVSIVDHSYTYGSTNTPGAGACCIMPMYDGVYRHYSATSGSYGFCGEDEMSNSGLASFELEGSGYVPASYGCSSLLSMTLTINIPVGDSFRPVQLCLPCNFETGECAISFYANWKGRDTSVSITACVSPTTKEGTVQSGPICTYPPQAPQNLDVAQNHRHPIDGVSASVTAPPPMVVDSETVYELTHPQFNAMVMFPYEIARRDALRFGPFAQICMKLGTLEPATHPTFYYGSERTGSSFVTRESECCEMDFTQTPGSVQKGTCPGYFSTYNSNGTVTAASVNDNVQANSFQCPLNSLSLIWHTSDGLYAFSACLSCLPNGRQCTASFMFDGVYVSVCASFSEEKNGDFPTSVCKLPSKAVSYY